jgi:hypothetical protein
MLAEHVVSPGARALRPHSSLLRTGVLAALALVVPTFALAYWITVPAGTGWVTAVALTLTIACLAFLGVQLRHISVVVSPEGVVERSFLGHVNGISNEEIGAVHLLEVYHENALDTVPNLFICDREGAVRVRLRGQYWSRESMETVADVLDQPLHYGDDAVTLAELRSSRPEWLYWFERVPVLQWL